MDDAFAAQREKLFADYTETWGAKPSWLRLHRRLDWELTAWAMRRAIGSGDVLSPRFFMFRCTSCHRMLTNAGLVKRGSCRCGSGKYEAQEMSGFWELTLAVLRGN